MARRQLPLGRADLPRRQPAPRRAAAPGTRQAPTTRPLGHDARVEPAVCALQPPDPRQRPQHDLYHRARPWWAWVGGPHVSRRLLHRALSGHRTQPQRPAPIVPPVFLAQWHPQPCFSANPWLDPRRWRTGLLAGPCLRRSLRQPRSDRHLRDRRWRGRDGRAGGQLAFQ